jgi:hypothetical protein
MTKEACIPYCPIRKISVERRGSRVKRFFVSEAWSAELKNLTEYRRSGTPGDFAALKNTGNSHIIAI